MKISVIIPHYNRDEMLRWCLKGLDAQSFPKEEYEVVVVGTLPAIATQDISCNIKLVPYEKKENEKFPVAHLRNLGAQKAEGEVLSFIDCDIVVSEDYLQNYWDILSKEDSLVFSLRKRIKEGVKINGLTDLKHADYEPDEREEVLKVMDWQIESIKSIFFWTYSHNIGIRKESFMKSGGFYENFVAWGYEDTELGYRLHKMGVPAVMDNKSKCYHLWHEGEYDVEKIRLSYLNVAIFEKMYKEQIIKAHEVKMDRPSLMRYAKKGLSVSALYLVLKEYFVRGYFNGLEDGKHAYVEKAEEVSEEKADKKVVKRELTSEFSETEFLVRLSECDPYGIAHNSNYFSWFETGRLMHASQSGYEIKEETLKDSKERLYITLKTKCKFIKPCKLHDVIVIKTRLVKAPSIYAIYTFEQVMYRKSTGEVLAKSVTENALVDRAENKVVAIERDKAMLNIRDSVENG